MHIGDEHSVHLLLGTGHGVVVVYVWEYHVVAEEDIPAGGALDTDDLVLHDGLPSLHELLLVLEDEHPNLAGGVLDSEHDMAVLGDRLLRYHPDNGDVLSPVLSVSIVRCGPLDGKERRELRTCFQELLELLVTRGEVAHEIVHGPSLLEALPILHEHLGGGHEVPTDHGLRSGAEHDHRTLLSVPGGHRPSYGPGRHGGYCRDLRRDRAIDENGGTALFLDETRSGRCSFGRRPGSGLHN